MQAPRKNIVILISGKGSNMVAIAEAAEREQWLTKFDAGIACVISNRPDADGLRAAAGMGLATEVVNHRNYASREEFDTALRLAVDFYRPSVVALAGFMRILTPAFVAHYAGRLVNIHPSLLPAFAGLNTHQRAIDAGCTTAGATVHLVTAELDHGPILAQAVVPIMDGDDAASLAARVLEHEHRIYPRAIRSML